MMNPSPVDLGRKHRAEPVPPEPYRLVADIDAPLKQQILDLAQRKRISNIHHHCQADDFGGAIEITERISSLHRLEKALLCLKPFYTDTAIDTPSP